jgi:hypothetical protein
MSDVDLSLVTLAEIEAELRKRYPLGVLAVMRDRTKTESDFYRSQWGSTFGRVGLLGLMKSVAEADVREVWLTKEEPQ